MGCDGGVELVKMRNPSMENYYRFWHLVSPFNIGFVGTSYHDRSRSEWENKNPEYTVPNWIISSYGDDVYSHYKGRHESEVIQDLSFLKTLIKFLEEEWWRGPRNNDIGFKELGITPEHNFEAFLEEQETRPLGEGNFDWFKCCLEYPLEHFYYAVNSEHKDNILKMSILDWKNEIQSLVDLDTIFTVETWT